MKNENFYKTRDFYSACILRSLGYELLRLEFLSGDTAVFVFSDLHNEASQAVKKYWDKNLPLDARTLIESIHELKSRIYSRV